MTSSKLLFLMFKVFFPRGISIFAYQLNFYGELLLMDHTESFLKVQVNHIDQTINTASSLMSPKNSSRLVRDYFYSPNQYQLSSDTSYLFTCGLILFSFMVSHQFLNAVFGLLCLWLPGASYKNWLHSCCLPFPWRPYQLMQ